MKKISLSPNCIQMRIQIAEAIKTSYLPTTHQFQQIYFMKTIYAYGMLLLIDTALESWLSFNGTKK